MPLFVVAIVSFAVMLVIVGRELLVCAALGQWSAVRAYGVLMLLFGAGIAGFVWGQASVLAQRLHASGVTVLTLRHGRLTIPWSAVQHATFDRWTALLEGRGVCARIGFAIYRNYREAEKFARDQLAASGASIQPNGAAAA